MKTNQVTPSQQFMFIHPLWHHCMVTRTYTYQIFTLLECYAAKNGSYRRFGTTYGSHLQGQSKKGCL
jgi:hypothetical protein